MLHVSSIWEPTWIQKILRTCSEHRSKSSPGPPGAPKTIPRGPKTSQRPLQDSILDSFCLNSKQTSHYLLRKVDAAELHYKHKSEDTNHKHIRRTSKIFHDPYGLDRPIGMYVITYYAQRCPTFELCRACLKLK